MAGVLIGQDAVDELERQLGRTPTDIERQIAMEEGYRPTVGKDIDGRAIIGFGQTGDFKNQTLDKVANIFEKRTERLIPNYNMLPDFVRNRAFDATYRGTLGQSPMTVDLMNAGQYGDAADEFLDNQEYRDAVISGSGVAARMERTADAFREYGNQKPKQVVPKMNKVDPRLLYEQRLAEAKQAQQKADLNRLQSVPPVDMNGGQVDPRGFTQNANKPKYAQLSGAGPAFNQLYNNLQPNNSSQAKPQGAPSYTTNYGSSVSPVTRPNSFLSPAAQAALAQVQNTNSPVIGQTGRGVTPYSLMPSASSVFIDPIFDSAAETAKKFGGQVGGVVDNIADGASMYGGMVSNAIDNTLDNVSNIASNFTEGFSDSDKSTPVAPIQQKPVVTDEQQALFSGNKYVPAPVISQAEADEQDRQNKLVDVRVAKAFEPTTSNTSSNKNSTTTATSVEPIDITKTKSGSIYDNLLPTEENTVVPVKSKEVTPVVDPVVDPVAITEEASKDPSNDGLPGKTSLDPVKGIATDNNGDVLPIGEDQVKDIFGKAASAFGDIFSGPDLKRMALYTIGGLLSGGSLQGSFKWAGLKVMEEQGQAKIAKAKLDEKTLANDRIVAREATSQENAESNATRLFQRQSAADAAVAQATQDHREAVGEAKVEAAKVLAAANLAKSRIDRLIAADKLRKDDKTGDLTGTTETYTVEGFEKFGIKTITAEQYYISNTSKGWRVPNPLAGQEGQPSYVSREGFRQLLMSDQYKGTWSKSAMELGSVTEEAKAQKIATFSHDMRQEVIKLYGEDLYAQGLQTASTIERYFQERGYDLSDTRTAAIAREIATRSAVEASNDAKDPNNSKRGTSLSPYMDKYAFSTAALASGSGVWAIEGGNKTIKASKVEAIVSQFRDGSKGKKGTRENHQAAMSNFTSWYKRYSNLKNEGKIPKLVYDKDTSNEFYAWLQSKLKNSKVTDTK